VKITRRHQEKIFSQKTTRELFFSENPRDFFSENVPGTFMVVTQNFVGLLDQSESGRIFCNEGRVVGLMSLIRVKLQKGRKLGKGPEGSSRIPTLNTFLANLSRAFLQVKRRLNLESRENKAFSGIRT
jgi:hypothetical protein